MMNLNSLFIKSIRTRSELLNYQTVRWRRPRKPFWLGIAKSKMFVIREPALIPTSEEKEVLDSLTFHYATAYKSLINFIASDNPALTEMTTVGGSTVKVSPALQERMSESLKVNERWNTESARRRDERMKESRESVVEKVIKEIDVHEEMRMKRLQFIEEVVRKEKVLSASYITPENLDQAVEDCLNKVECYDFAIDLDGNKYPGRESLPPHFSTIKEETPAENVS